jgi:transcriptional repressor NrdR
MIGAQKPQRFGALHAECESRVIQFDAEVAANAREERRLVGFHAQERITRVEKDSLNVTFHCECFILRKEPLPSCATNLVKMLCPVCRASETRVIDSRDDENAVRRRRECLACKHRFTTFERPEASRLYVVKKDGRREAYNREKVVGGLRKASEKRPVSESAIQEVADRVERELQARGESEVASTIVGDLVMAELRKLDKVAYIRFASVYRSFADLDSFQEELAQLRGPNE